MMIWVFFLVITVVVVAGFAALLLGRVTYDPMPAATASRPRVALPESSRSTDVDDLHFDTALRGYRMDQVDDVLDQLKARLAQYEQGQVDVATMRLAKVRALNPTPPRNAPDG